MDSFWNSFFRVLRLIVYFDSIHANKMISEKKSGIVEKQIFRFGSNVGWKWECFVFQTYFFECSKKSSKNFELFLFCVKMSNYFVAKLGIAFLFFAALSHFCKIELKNLVVIFFEISYGKISNSLFTNVSIIADNFPACIIRVKIERSMLVGIRHLAEEAPAPVSHAVHGSFIIISSSTESINTLSIAENDTRVNFWSRVRRTDLPVVFIFRVVLNAVVAEVEFAWIATTYNPHFVVMNRHRGPVMWVNRGRNISDLILAVKCLTVFFSDSVFVETKMSSIIKSLNSINII